MNKSEFDRPWTLKQFRRPTTKAILVKCETCHPAPKSFKRVEAKRETSRITKVESEYITDQNE